MLAALALLACGEAPPPPPDPSERAHYVVDERADAVLEGKVVYRAEDGGDAYVLDVGRAPVLERSAPEGVRLRASGAVSLDDFAKYEGRTVQVRGRYVATRPVGAFEVLVILPVLER